MEQIHWVFSHKLGERISHFPSCAHHAVLTPAPNVLQSELYFGQSTAGNSCVHSICVQSEQSETDVLVETLMGCADLI